jgi:hypothetical protein
VLRHSILGAALAVAFFMSAWVAHAEPTISDPTWSPGDVIGATWLCKTQDDIRYVLSRGQTEDGMREAILELALVRQCATRPVPTAVPLAEFVGYFSAFAGPGEIWKTSAGWFALVAPKSGKPKGDPA